MCFYICLCLLCHNMDLHIVVSIILDYHQDFCQWTSARTLNKKSKEIVDRRPYDKECVGQRMWLKQEECMICQRANPRVKWLQYCSDTPASQRWISHCRKWSCYASALYSMVVDYKADGVYILRQPLGIASEINIPRSNGTVSRGWFRHGCIIKRCEHWYVSAEWTKGDSQYQKLVPLTYFTKEKPKLMFSDF